MSKAFINGNVRFEALQNALNSSVTRQPFIFDIFFDIIIGGSIYFAGSVATPYLANKKMESDHNYY